MAMKFRIFSATGERGAQVSLALRKSDVAQRLLTCLQSKDLAKSGKFTINSLVKIDSGEFSVHSLPALGYSKSEIEDAITRRVEEIDIECEELAGLQKLLRDGSFGAVQGGREAELKSDWKELVSPRLSKAGRETRDMKKSMQSRLGQSEDVLMAHSFEKAQGGHGITEFHSGAHPGHVVQINDLTQRWKHTKGGPGGKVLAESKRDASPVQAAAHLNFHLSEFRGV